MRKRMVTIVIVIVPIVAFYVMRKRMVIIVIVIVPIVAFYVLDNLDTKKTVLLIANV